MFERAFGTAGDGVGEEVDVLEPDESAAAKHGDGLHGFAEAVDGGFDFGDVAGESTNGFAGKFVVDFPGEFIVALPAEATDKEVIGTADEDEWFGIGHEETLGDKLEGGGATQNCRRRAEVAKLPSCHLAIIGVSFEGGRVG